MAVINKGEERAVAIHLVHAMLNEGVESYVAAGDWLGRRTLGDVEGERRGSEISRAVLATGNDFVTQTGNSHAAISYARTRSWLSIAAGGVVVEMGVVVAMVHVTSLTLAALGRLSGKLLVLLAMFARAPQPSSGVWQVVLALVSQQLNGP
jgi:hypothetical protein